MQCFLGRVQGPLLMIRLLWGHQTPALLPKRSAICAILFYEQRVVAANSCVIPLWPEGSFSIYSLRVSEVKIVWKGNRRYRYMRLYPRHLPYPVGFRGLLLVLEGLCSTLGSCRHPLDQKLYYTRAVMTNLRHDRHCMGKLCLSTP